MRQRLQHFALAVLLVALPAAAGATALRGLTPLERQVRHELVTLPYYSVFDNLAFRVEGSTVTLSGQTIRPTIKTAAGRVVARLEGVESVVNQIEVLPLSSYDDDIRRRVARAIYTSPVLDRYALGAVPRIHIIVKKGHVTLEGVVIRESEKNVAFVEASGVSGVFKVTNNLRVDMQG